jgi:Ku70/Ku80 beta-barrel domain
MLYGEFDASLQGANHVLVLIDSNSVLTEENDTMNSTLRLLESIVRAKIRMVTIHKIGKRDGFGVVLYSTKYRTPRRLRNFDDGNDFDIDEATKKEKTRDDGDDEETDDEDWNEQVSSTELQSTVHEIIPLSPPGVVTVKQIQGAMSDNITCDPKFELDLIPEYKDEYYGKNSADSENDNDQIINNSLQVALHQAIQIFRTAKCVKVPPKNNTNTPLDKKQIWILSSNDNPCPLSQLPMIQTTAYDAQESNIEILIWPIITNDKTKLPTFDYSKFYDQIKAYSPLRDLEQQQEDQECDDENQLQNIIQDAMISCMQQEYKKIRRTLCIPLLLPNWNSSGDNSTEENQVKKEDQTNTTKIIPDETSSRSSNTSSLNQWPPKSGIMIDVFKLIQPARKPPKVQIHIETGRVLSRIRQILSVGGGGGGTDVIAEYKSFGSPSTRRTSAAIAERRLGRYVTFGGERVPMTKQDQTAVRKAANANTEFASLILLGFKPISSIPFYHTLEQTYFVYPTADEVDDGNDSKKKDEDKAAITTGGCEAFVHLRSSMIRKGVIAVGELLTRVTASSRLVVLWPTGTISSQYYENGIKSSDVVDCNMRIQNGVNHDQLPPGLAMATIPFEDEMRAQEIDIALQSFEATGTDLASSALVSAMSDLIQKQTLTDVEIGENFDNAALLQFWDYVEQIALGETTEQQKRYYDTILDRKEIRRIVGTQIEQINQLLPEDVKLAKTSATGGGRKRKIEPDDSGIDWQSLYAENRLSDCKVPDLKKKLRSLGEAVSGIKAEVRSFLCAR